MFRLLEHYVSVQGECDRTGTLTQFIRFAGCNLKCPGWPCDTEFAIDPKQYTKLQILTSVDELLLATDKVYDETGARNICLTGGEPMLQPTHALQAFITALVARGHTVEMFSNGTIRYTNDIIDNCSIRLDWKLPGSGESSDHPVRDENVDRLWARSHKPNSPSHTLKFTVATREDFLVALGMYTECDLNEWPGSIYVGPVWDKELTPSQIVQLMIDAKLPWKLNLQIHKFIWPADMRGT